MMTILIKFRCFKKWIKKYPTVFTLLIVGVIMIINFQIGIGVGIGLAIVKIADYTSNYLNKKIDWYLKVRALKTKVREARRQEIIEHNRKNTPHIELIKKNNKFYWKVKIPNKKIKYIPQRIGDQAENILSSLYDRMHLEEDRT